MNILLAISLALYYVTAVPMNPNLFGLSISDAEKMARYEQLLFKFHDKILFTKSIQEKEKLLEQSSIELYKLQSLRYPYLIRPQTFHVDPADAKNSKD